MSAENVETLRGIYDLMWREGRIDEAVARLPHDIEWVIPQAVGATLRRGQEEVSRFFHNWLEVFEPTEVHYEFIDAGDRVVVRGYFRAVSKGSGLETDMRFGQLWTVEQDTLVRCQWYETAEEALEAAGLSE